MRKYNNSILLLLLLIAANHQPLFAQGSDSLSSKDTFTTYFTSRTTQLNSIGVGFGDQFNIWYYYMTPITGSERLKYVSFGFGFGGAGAGYVMYKENGDLIDNNDNSYFFFLGGSVGITFFITDKLFLHTAFGAEYWFGDTHSGSNYTYEYEEGFMRAGVFTPRTSIGLFSVIPISKYSTTSVGVAYNFNGFQDRSYSIIFTFY